MLGNKAISPVVATALLLVVAVVAVVSFQSWFGTYSSGVFVDVEQKSSTGSQIFIDGVVGDDLYMRIPAEEEISLIKIVDTSGVSLCEFKVDDSGLVGYWDFDLSNATHVKDKSSLGNDASFNGGLSDLDLVDGVNGKGIKLDGVDDFLEIPYNVVYDFGTGNFTISVWVNKHSPSSAFTSYSSFAMWRDGFTPSTCNWLMSLTLLGNDDEVAFGMASGGTNYVASYPPEISINEWYHLVGVRESNLLKLYIDGVLVNTTDMGGILSVNSNALDLKIGTGDQELFFTNATFDEFALFNRALSESEVLGLYTASLENKEVMSEFDVSSCNLQSGSAYEVVVIGSLQTLSKEFVAK